MKKFASQVVFLMYIFQRGEVGSDYHLVKAILKLTSYSLMLHAVSTIQLTRYNLGFTNY